MKKYILSATIIFLSTVAYAQQLHTSSLYDMQGILHNPSMVGVFQDENTKGMLGLTHRMQWSGIEGGPQTTTLFGSFNLPKQKIGIGGYAYTDKTGPTSRTGLQISLAKHIRFNDGAVFSIGLETRLQQYAIDRAKLAESIGNDPALGTSDNRFKYDAGFGIAYSNKDWQFGASVSQLIQSKLDFYSGNLSTTESARLYRHYYFHGKYNWNIDDNTVISPNFLVVYLPNAPTEFTGGIKVEHRKLIWWGIGYRAEQNWLLSLGIHIKQKFTLGYGYDIYKNPVGYFDGGSNAHEFLLRYNFQK